MVVGDSVGSGILLKSMKIAAEDYAAYGVSPLAESAQTLTATISPSNAADKTVDWTVAWVNAGSSWANGKTVTDYVTVTPTSDGALTATVECLQAFGEQIKVTVTSRANTSAKAEATVDYAKQVVSIVGWNFYAANQNGNSYTKGDLLYEFSQDGTLHSFEPCYSDEGNLMYLDQEMLLEPEVNYSVYTLDQDIEFTFYLWFSEEAYSAFESAGFEVVQANGNHRKVEVMKPLYLFPMYFIGSISGSDRAEIEAMEGEAYEKYAEVMRSLAGKELFHIWVECSASRFSYEPSFAISPDFFPSNTISVALDKYSIVFDGGN